MGQSKFKFIVFLAIFALVFGSALAEKGSPVTRSFDVGAGGKLFLKSDKGSIEVTSWNKDQVEVTVYKEVRGWGNDDLLEEFVVSMSKHGDNVEVIGEFKHRGSFWNNDNGKLRVRYVIIVPKKYNLDMKTAGGSIDVEDLEGRIDARTSGGSLKFGSIDGPVNGHTSGGSITLRSSNGDAELKTSGGSINIGDVNGYVQARTSGGSINIDRAAGEVIAKTSGGSITVDEVNGKIDASTSGGSVRARITKQPKSSCRLSTSGGSVIVSMASDIKVNVSARTSGGRVKTDFPVTIQGELKKTALDATINGGGPELYLRTSGGNVELHEL